MTWKEPKNYTDDCYFCAINLTGINKKKRKSLIYPNLPSTLRPVAHCDELPIPVFKELPDVPNENLDMNFEEQDDLNDNDFVRKSSAPIFFNQKELSDLSRDLNLSKESSELLAFRLNDQNLLQQGTKITFYRTRDDKFLRFFEELPDFVFYIDIPGLLLKLSVNEYKPEEWRLFSDSSKRSLICVLLHNSNMYAPIPIGHSITLKEKHDAIKTVFKHIKYEHHQWSVCVDLKMVNFRLCQQSGYTKPPCFLCY